MLPVKSHKLWKELFLDIFLLNLTLHSIFRHSYLQTFQFHKIYGNEVVDEFSTARERRDAIRKAVSLLKEHYGDKTDSMRAIATLFPGAKVEHKEQLTMF